MRENVLRADDKRALEGNLERRKLSAVASETKTKPEHTARSSNATPWVMPSAAWMETADAGKVLSGVEVAEQR